MINKTVKVHNGKSTKDIKLTVDHVQHRLGEFYHTKVTPRFKGVKKKY
jgi:ribosomal protein S19